jgi:hypothetical protein
MLFTVYFVFSAILVFQNFSKATLKFHKSLTVNVSSNTQSKVMSLTPSVVQILLRKTEDKANNMILYNHTVLLLFNPFVRKGTGQPISMGFFLKAKLLQGQGCFNNFSTQPSQTVSFMIHNHKSQFGTQVQLLLHN